MQPIICFSISNSRYLRNHKSGVAYFQNDLKAAFWFLVAGAGIDFIIQCLDPDTGTEKQKQEPVQ